MAQVFQLSGFTPRLKSRALCAFSECTGDPGRTGEGAALPPLSGINSDNSRSLNLLLRFQRTSLHSFPVHPPHHQPPCRLHHSHNANSALSSRPNPFLCKAILTLSISPEQLRVFKRELAFGTATVLATAWSRSGQDVTGRDNKHDCG